MAKVTSEDLHLPGRWLAHYTTALAAFEHILPTRKLRLSPYRMMRDPVETKAFPFVAEFSGADRPDLVAPFLDAAQHINRLRDGVRLLSLTRDAAACSADHDVVFGCCWARPRMWEQYGEIHAGACLVFDRAALVQCLKDHGVQYVDEVRYRPAGIAGSQGSVLSDSRLFRRETLHRAAREHLDRHHEDLLFLKSEDWAAEFEFRAALLDPSTDYAFLPYRDALSAVLVGERFPKWQLPAARAACASAGVLIRRMAWSQGRPGADPVNVPTLRELFDERHGMRNRTHRAADAQTCSGPDQKRPSAR